MDQPKQGYDFPFVEEPGYQISFICISLMALAGSLWFAWSEGQPVLLVITALFLALILVCAGELLARLHIVPEGITITLFGLTVRRLQAENIRVIVGVRKFNNKGSSEDLMAICVNSVEELTVLGNQHMLKLLQNDADRWYGQTAAKYLYRRAVSIRGELNLHKHILWLYWSPERLEILRQMYPSAQWLDGTERKLFDAQLQSM